MSEPSDVLTRAELLFLAAAVREMMRADGVVSDGEIDLAMGMTRRLGLGEAEWESIWNEAQRALPNATAVENAAKDLKRLEARELVYELLYRVAEDGSIVDSEWDLLELLDETWRYVDAGGDG